MDSGFHRSNGKSVIPAQAGIQKSVMLTIDCPTLKT